LHRLGGAGFEIVQSVFPGWKFAPADTVIVNGSHGALLLAPRHPAGFGSATAWVSNLAGFEIELLRDAAVVDRGHAANVLYGPLSALRHLVGLLARDRVNSPLATGDIVATGTLTRAFPILPGESWRRRFTASSSAAGLFGSREPDVASSADGPTHRTCPLAILGRLKHTVDAANLGRTPNWKNC
jgi:2-keto-4-pentenoate hydratase